VLFVFVFVNSRRSIASHSSNKIKKKIFSFSIWILLLFFNVIS
jgi:hypothetical protein